MKKILKTPLISVMLFVTLAGFLPGCKDKDVKSDQVELLSFGPSGVVPGENITFIGNNLDKVTEVDFTGATVAKANFVSQTSEMIVITAPLTTEEGPIMLKTTQGDIMSKTLLSFKVAVTISSFTPQARPGGTLTINGEFVNWITKVTFAKDIVVIDTNFVSRSVNQVVVKVPDNAQTGFLTFSTGGTKPLSIDSEDQFIVTLPSVTSLAPNPIEAGDTLTITGLNLDLAKSVTLKGVTGNITTFITHTATSIQLVFPATANKGKVGLVAGSGVTVESDDVLALAGALPPLAPLAKVFYDDDVQGGWQKWGGWGGGSADMANTDNVRDGNTAIKVVFASDWGGALQLGGGNTSTTGLTEISFSIFGNPGSGGQKLNVIVAGIQKEFAIVEGEWTEYKVPLTDYSSPGTVNEFTLQSQGWAGSIYIDYIGLR